MRLQIERAGNVTSGEVESSGITVLGGPNIEARTALLTTAYAAEGACRMGLLPDGPAELGPRTGAEHAGAHADPNRCAARAPMGERSCVRLTVSPTEPASSGAAGCLPVDRIGLTRRHAPYDRHAPGVIENLATALEKESGRPPEADRRWGNRVGGRHRRRQQH